MRVRIASLCALFITLAASTALATHAQAVAGIGDDAMVLPRGTLRIRFAPSWTEFDSRYGLDTPERAAGSSEPLGLDFTSDTLGIEQLELLVPLEQELRSLTGISNFSVSLGRTRLDLRSSVRALPIVAEVGLTRRISMAVVVPLVRTRSEAILSVNPAGSEGNLGFNPAMSISAARDQNTQLVNQLLTAALTLETAVGGPVFCESPAGQLDSRCALIASTRQFAGGIAGIYGVGDITVPGFDALSGNAGALVIPITNTTAQLAIAARVQDFKSRYGQIGDTITSSGPFPAQSVLGVQDAHRIFSDPLFGLAVAPLQTVERTAIGDIEISAKLQLFNTLGDERRFEPPAGLFLRSAVTSVVRLGTGRTDSPDNLIDVGTGNGQTDLEIRSQNDLIFGRRFWASVVGRYTWQLADHEVLRVAPPSQPIAAFYRRQRVERKLGDYYDVEVTPRLVVSDYLALSAQYYYRNKVEDRYGGRFEVTNLLDEEVTLDAAVLNEETAQTEHRVYGGISFSTLAAVQNGKARIPLEVMYQYGQSVRGDGGRTPRISQSAIQVRIYTRIFGAGDGRR